MRTKLGSYLSSEEGFLIWFQMTIQIKTSEEALQFNDVHVYTGNVYLTNSFTLNI